MYHIDHLQLITYPRIKHGAIVCIFHRHMYLLLADISCKTTLLHAWSHMSKYMHAYARIFTVKYVPMLFTNKAGSNMFMCSIIKREGHCKLGTVKFCHHLRYWRLLQRSLPTDSPFDDLSSKKMYDFHIFSRCSMKHAHSHKFFAINAFLHKH